MPQLLLSLPSLITCLNYATAGVLWAGCVARAHWCPADAKLRSLSRRLRQC
jgi:hypothetical protein